MNKKKKNKGKIIFILCFLLFLTLQGECFAADPTLIAKLRNAFEKLQGYILRLATPVAAVSVGVGALMRKFSFGDEERIVTRQEID